MRKGEAQRGERKEEDILSMYDFIYIKFLFDKVKC